MANQFERTELLIGKEKQTSLFNKRVAVFGVGGVGGYAIEALARAGIGHITLIDNDNVSLSNINRQIIALHSNIGQPKVDVAKARILDINPDCEVTTYNQFFLDENDFDFSSYDYVIDAIDTIKGKINIICACDKLGIPVISAMGAGNKLHPEMFKITDIYKTEMCPLAKVMRYELRKRNIKHLKVVYSKEEPIRITAISDDVDSKKRIPGSISFVPSVAGLLIASEVINDLLKE